MDNLKVLWGGQTEYEEPSFLPKKLVLLYKYLQWSEDFNMLESVLQVLEACVESGALRGGHGHTESESTTRVAAIARLQAEDTSSADSRASSGFGGVQFWDALRQVACSESAKFSQDYLAGVTFDPGPASLSMFISQLQVKGLESEVRYHLTEARIVLRRRSVIPLMVCPFIEALAWVMSRCMRKLTIWDLQ
jgi:hypothetical protein